MYEKRIRGKCDLRFQRSGQCLYHIGTRDSGPNLENIAICFVFPLVDEYMVFDQCSWLVDCFLYGIIDFAYQFFLLKEF